MAKEYTIKEAAEKLGVSKSAITQAINTTGSLKAHKVPSPTATGYHWLIAEDELERYRRESHIEYLKRKGEPG